MLQQEPSSATLMNASLLFGLIETRNLKGLDNRLYFVIQSKCFLLQITIIISKLGNYYFLTMQSRFEINIKLLRMRERVYETLSTIVIYNLRSPPSQYVDPQPTICHLTDLKLSAAKLTIMAFAILVWCHATYGYSPISIPHKILYTKQIFR